jgi:hypothetical protein
VNGTPAFIYGLSGELEADDLEIVVKVDKEDGIVMLALYTPQWDRYAKHPLVVEIDPCEADILAQCIADASRVAHRIAQRGAE